MLSPVIFKNHPQQILLNYFFILAKLIGEKASPFNFDFLLYEKMASFSQYLSNLFLWCPLFCVFLLLIFVIDLYGLFKKGI